MEGLQVKVVNYSDIVWNLNNWHVGAGESDDKNWPDEITQSPSDQLAAYDGQTTAAVNSEHLTFIVKDALWMVVGYGSTAGNFAVRLQQHFHMFGLGPQDGWAHWDDTKKAWSEITTDTTPQTWVFGNYEVRATPTLSNSGGSISILIKNKSKK